MNTTLLVTGEQVARFLEVTAELCDKQEELAQLVAAEKEGKVTGYFRANETSVSARDREAEFQVLNVTTDIIRLKGQIAALETEHRTLSILMECASRNLVVAHAGER
jgi:hypothetical protein